MDLQLKGIHTIPSDRSVIYLIDKDASLEKYSFSEVELSYIKGRLDTDKKQAAINSYARWVFIRVLEDGEHDYIVLEKLRKAGYTLYHDIKEQEINEIVVVNDSNLPGASLALAEGLALSSYQFLKYQKDKEEKRSPLRKILLYNKNLSDQDISQLGALTEGMVHARNLINEPLSYLSATQLAREIRKLGKAAGFMVEVFNKKKIESLKMGGLLAVNKGSIDPPTFSILEWKPERPKNKKPLILVGKGIVFDTGGLSLKPTKDSMDQMKADMSGGAAVASVLYAVSKARLPVHVIGLVPATDNRPDGNAYVPGDVIKMHNGLTVEVLNTDAEGRMILADALSYARQYGPELVIDLATLTGSAALAIGKYGIVGMGNADRKYFNQLKKSGENVYERIAEFPFWEEYHEIMKSDIADIKNIGGRNAGAITAGKFLERFTDYPYIHLDIAGPAFLIREDSYRGKGGTGVGVRLIFDFIKNYPV